MTNQIGVGSIIGLAGASGSTPGTGSMFAALQALGLTSGLQTCVDAGDPTSAPGGSSQTWVDLTGNGYGFFRGNTASVEASDPTFNGTPGTQSSANYWSVNGSQWFTLNQTNPAWVSALHKDNAVFTIAEWVFANNVNSTAKVCGIIGTNANTGIGFEFGNSGAVGSGRNLGFIVGNGPSSNALVTDSASVTFNNNAWNFIGMSFTEATGSLTFMANGIYEVQSGKTYASPSSGAAVATLQVGAQGSGANPENSGDRFGNISIWNTSLTQAQLTSIFSATRAKFGV